MHPVKTKLLSTFYSEDKILNFESVLSEKVCKCIQSLDGSKKTTGCIIIKGSFLCVYLANIAPV